MADKKYIQFIDNSGRAILGVNSLETDNSLKVENPVMITVQQQQNGQMAVQLFPLFFQEFVNPDKDSYRID